MVTLGVDCHKKSHTVVAIDEHGRMLGSRTIKSTSAGHLEALRFAEQWMERCWAVENVRSLSRRLEGELLLAGESVLHVSPQLMAGQRRSSRERGKSDAIDALNVARVLLREGGDLPVAHLDGPSRELKLLVDHRGDLVQERTQKINRLRWHLHELEPDFEVGSRSLDRRRTLNRVSEMLRRHQGTMARIGSELVDDIRRLNERVKNLEEELQELARELVPHVLQLQGCGAVTAATLVAETADVSRFASRAAFAMFNGTAPIPASSGNTSRVRLNRGGNRKVNAALHTIAVTQIGHKGLGYEYFQHRLREHDTAVEARRALRRRLSDVVYACLLQDHALHATPGGGEVGPEVAA